MKMLALYNEAIKHYYTDGLEPIMSDTEFDGLRNQLIESGELNEDEEVVGFDDNSSKLAHVIKMGSLHSYHTHGQIHQADIDFFKARFSNDFSLKDCTVFSTFKYDGLSVTARYVNGLLDKILTRGSGYHGTNITSKISHLFPKEILASYEHTELRGEIIMRKSVFEAKYSKEVGGDYENPRNCVSGLIGRNDDFGISDIEVVLYKIAGFVDGKILFSKYDNTELRDALSITGFSDMIDKTSREHLLSELSEVFEDFSNLRDYFDYPTDGVVTCASDIQDMHGKNWLHSMAWKFDAPKAVTTIKDIIWNEASNGRFTPVGILEPVYFAGSKQKRVNLFSYGFIIEKGLWPGATISLQKSGDIIPHVHKVIQPVKYTDVIPLGLVPKQDLEIRGKHIYALSINPHLKFIKGLMKANIDDMGPSKCEELYNAGITTITKLMNFVLSIHRDENHDFTQELKHTLCDVWDKNWEKIAPRLYDRFTTIHLEHLLHCLELDGFGWTNCLKLASAIANEDPSRLPNHKIYETIDFIELSEMFKKYKHLITYTHLLDKTDDTDVITESNESKSNLLKICLTGSPKPHFSTKSEFLAHLTSKHIQYEEVDIKKCDILISDKPDKSGNKIDYAKSKNIEIKTYESYA